MWHLVHADIVHNGIMYRHFVCFYVVVYGLLMLCDISSMLLHNKHTVGSSVWCSHCINTPKFHQDSGQK